MEDHKISFNKHCPCTQSQCPIHGNCVLCVQNHNDHKRHIPECMQILIRPAIESLAKRVELSVSEGRPDKHYWEEFDSAAFLEKTLERHKKE